MGCYHVGDWLKINSNSFHIFAGTWVKIVKIEYVLGSVPRYTIEFEGEKYYVGPADIERHSPSATYKASYRYSDPFGLDEKSIITYDTLVNYNSEWWKSKREELLKSRYLGDWMEQLCNVTKKEENVMPKIPEIKNVYFNDPATVVIWADKTKTIVKCSENDFYDPEKGLAMAIIKKLMGNDNTYHKIFKKWVPEEEPIDDEMISSLFASLFEGLAKAGYPIAKVDNVTNEGEETVIECHYEED